MSERKLEIIAILEACEDCSPSGCCQACDASCSDEHDTLHDELYKIFEEDKP